jgi:tRNA (guanine37-N1)-methyltransferase
MRNPMIGIKVPKNNADKIRRVLLNHNIIKLDMKIKRVEDFVYIPLINTPNKELLEELNVL